MTRNIFVYLILFSISILNARSQTTNYNLPRLAAQNKIKVINREVTTAGNDSISSIHLSSKENDGVAWIDGLEFSNGIIEIDMKGKDILQQSFVGIAFHGVDEKTLDVVYFRPFNFQSTDTLRVSHAVQYASHPQYPWAILRDKFPGQYEKSIYPAPAPNAWFHVKLVVTYPLIKVFVNNNANGCLTVQQLNERTTGKLGLWVGNNSDGDFANLAITKQ